MYHIPEYYDDEDYYYLDGTEESYGDDRDFCPEAGKRGGGVSDQELEEDEAGSGKVDERFLIDAFLKASGMRHGDCLGWVDFAFGI